MSPETYFSDSPDVYAKGRYVSFAAGENTYITERINDREHDQVFLDANDLDGLPYPVSRVRLNSFWETSDSSKIQDDDEKYFTVDASVDFDPGVFYENNDTQPEALLDSLRKNIKEYSKQRVTRLPHDPLTLYLADGSPTVIRVVYSATLTEATLSIETNNINNLDIITASDFQSFVTVPDTTPEELFKRATNTLATILDTLHSSYNRDMSPSGHFNYEFKGPREFEQPEMRSEIIRTTLGLTATKSIDVRTAGTPDRSEYVIEPKPNTFNALGGLDVPKEKLIELGDIFKGRELASRYGLRTQPILLYGPPGTGKTSLVKALADYTDARLESRRSKDIIDKMVGDSPKYLARFFEDIYEQPFRTIIFLDEIDAFASKRVLGVSAAYAEVQRELQQQISEELPKHPHVLLVAATNSDIDDISEPMTRSGRFEPLFVDRPNATERIDIWYTILQRKQEEFAHLSYTDPESDKIQPIAEFVSYDFDALSKRTDGLTGADIEAIIQDAVKICYKNHRMSGENQLLTNDILFRAITARGRR